MLQVIPEKNRVQDAKVKTFFQDGFCRVHRTVFFMKFRLYRSPRCHVIPEKALSVPGVAGDREFHRRQSQEVKPG